MLIVVNQNNYLDSINDYLIMVGLLLVPYLSSSYTYSVLSVTIMLSDIVVQGMMGEYSCTIICIIISEKMYN